MRQCSVCLLVWGWKPDDKLAGKQRGLQKALQYGKQNWDRNNVRGKSRNAKNMLNHDVCRFISSGQGNEMGRLGKTVNNIQND